MGFVRRHNSQSCSHDQNQETISGLSTITSLPFEEFRNNNGPIIDIRSPKEFSQGHWPGSTNIPLFSNKEREIVGITYKQKGSREAISIGIKLIIPKLSSLKNSLNLLNNKTQNDTETSEKKYLRFYCWRGGLRSKSVVWLATLLGLNAIQLKGGYKSYRKWVLNQFEKDWNINLIGGKTGSGKTNLLHSLAKEGIATIDLEGLANHRGSSFGAMGLSVQPSCEQYENLLAESLNKLNSRSSNAIWVEDESPNLGRCRIPNGLMKQMRIAPLLEIIKNKEERVQELINVYSQHSKRELKEATLRIQKRLGPQRTQTALNAISENNWEIACKAILDYYDRCYEHQLLKVKNKLKVNLSGLKDEIAAKKLINDGFIY